MRTAHIAPHTSWKQALALRITIALVALAASRVPAIAQPAQTEFVIAGMGGPQTNLYTPDTSQAGVTMRLAAKCYLNLLLSPTYCETEYGGCTMAGATPFLSTDPKSDLKTAATLGLKFMVFGSALSPQPVPRPPGLTDTEWAAFMGYRLTDESADGYPAPSPELQAGHETLHNADPTKAIYINEIHTGMVSAWMALPQPERPDFFSGETYVPNSYEAYATTYPPYAGHYPLVDDMKLAAGTAPFWSLAYVNGNGYEFPDPNETALRAMAFIPVSYGARGIVWSQWADLSEPRLGAQVSYDQGHENGTQMGSLTTNAFWRLQRINRYLRYVVGPAVMKSDHLWVLHKRYSVEGDPEPWVPNISRYIVGPDKPFFQDPADIPEKIMVSIWQPRAGTGEPAGAYYLLVMNTLLTPNSGTLQLRAATGLGIGAAPSVVGYQGGSSYAPVSTTTTPVGGLQVTSFPVSLQGAEARMYKVVPIGTNSDLAGLVAPVGGESWSGGSSQTISWRGISSTGVVLRLYTDEPRSSAPDGPYVTLTPGAITEVDGLYSTSISVPGVSTSRGRIEVAGTTANGAFARATHSGRIRIASAVALEVAVSDIVQTEGKASAAFRVSPWGNTGLLFAVDRDFEAKVWTGVGQPIVTVPDHPGPIPGSSSPYGWFGVSPALCFGAGGVVHSAYFSLFQDLLDDGSGNMVRNQLLRYARKSGNTWTRETIAYVGGAQAGCAIALDPDGQPYVAYNSGSKGQYFLHVAHRNPDGTWTDLGVAGGRNPRNICIGVDPDGNCWVSHVSRNILYVGNGYFEPGSFGSLMSVANVTGPATMQMASDGVPEIAYVKEGANGSQTLYFQRVEWQPNGTYGSPPETIDGTVKAVDDLGLAQQVPTTLVAYACNGVLRQGIRGGGGSWNVYDMDTAHDVGAPLGFGIAPDNRRWITYWDRPANMLRLAIYTESSGGGEGGGEDPPIQPAVWLRSENPMMLGGALLFELKLPRTAGVRVQIFDVAGRVVAERPTMQQAAGQSRLRWRPQSLPPGMFFVCLRIDGQIVLNRRIAVFH